MDGIVVGDNWVMDVDGQQSTSPKPKVEGMTDEVRQMTHLTLNL